MVQIKISSVGWVQIFVASEAPSTDSSTVSELNDRRHTAVVNLQEKSVRLSLGQIASVLTVAGEPVVACVCTDLCTLNPD